MICCRFDCGWQVWDRRNLARYFSIFISNIFELEFQARSKIKKNAFQTRGRVQEKPDTRSTLQHLTRDRQQAHPSKVPRKVEKVKFCIQEKIVFLKQYIYIYIYMDIIQTVFNMQNTVFLTIV